MHPALAAFPRRVFRLRTGTGGFGRVVWSLIGVLLFGAFGVFLALQVLPALQTDYAIRDSAKPLPGARLVNGTCRSKLALLHTCDLELVWRSGGTEYRRKISYAFVDPHVGSYSVQVMGDAQRPELLTTDLGLERLTNRTLTLAGGALLTLLLVGGSLLGLRAPSGLRAQAKALAGARLEPVAVRFQGWTGKGEWTVEDERGGRWSWQVPRKARPFVLDPGRALVLALRPEGGGPAFALDSDLRLADLTREERAAVLAAR
jgi:hypothetical protein